MLDQKEYIFMHSFIHTFIAFEHYTVPVAIGTGL